MDGDDINTLEASVVATVVSAFSLVVLHLSGLQQESGAIMGALYGFWCAMILVRVGWIKPN